MYNYVVVYTVHVISKNIDGGASAPVGPSVATPLRVSHGQTVWVERSDFASSIIEHIKLWPYNIESQVHVHNQGRSQKFLISEADLVLDHEIMLHLSQIPRLHS